LTGSKAENSLPTQAKFPLIHRRMVPKYGGKENTRTITVLKTSFYLSPLANSYMTKVARKMHEHLVPYLLYTSTHKHYFKT